MPVIGSRKFNEELHNAPCYEIKLEMKYRTLTVTVCSFGATGIPFNIWVIYLQKSPSQLHTTSPNTATDLRLPQEIFKWPEMLFLYGEGGA